MPTNTELKGKGGTKIRPAPTNKHNPINKDKPNIAIQAGLSDLN